MAEIKSLRAVLSFGFCSVSIPPQGYLGRQAGHIRFNQAMMWHVCLCVRGSCCASLHRHVHPQQLCLVAWKAAEQPISVFAVGLRHGELPTCMARSLEAACQPLPWNV